MTTCRDVVAATAEAGMGVVGGFHPEPGDSVPEGTETLLLLGPAGPELWAAFSASAEAADGLPDPMDRWSRRVIDRMAAMLGAQALYPFEGPPWSPFHTWAAKGEGAVCSPVAMMASGGRGLWVSFRGALAFKAKMDLPPRAEAPCAPCPAPCKTACPVDAFAGDGYDVPRCVAHIRSDSGAECRSGCLVRRACPAGSHLDLPLDQRRFHMAAFLNAQR